MTASAIRHEDLLVDADTGEVSQWPAGIGPDRLDYLMQQHREAAEQADLWETRKRNLSRAMERELAALGVRNYVGSDTKATMYAGGVTRTATVERLREALQWKVINEEQHMLLLLSCATRLDPKELDQRVKDKIITQEQADYLITSEDRAGHVRTAPLAKLAPEKRDK